MEDSDEKPKAKVEPEVKVEPKVKVEPEVKIKSKPDKVKDEPEEDVKITETPKNEDDASDASDENDVKHETIAVEIIGKANVEDKAENIDEALDEIKMEDSKEVEKIEALEAFKEKENEKSAKTYAKKAPNAYKELTFEELTFKELTFRELTFDKYANEYQDEKRSEIKLERDAKKAGDFYVPSNPKLAFVMKIPDTNQVAPKVKKTFQLFRLRQISNGVFIKLNEARRVGAAIGVLARNPTRANPRLIDPGILNIKTLPAKIPEYQDAAIKLLTWDPGRSRLLLLLLQTWTELDMSAGDLEQSPGKTARRTELTFCHHSEANLGLEFCQIQE